MEKYAELAQRLNEALRLGLSPIAVCMVEGDTEGIKPYDRDKVAAGCLFWQEAATGPFVTTARDHSLCSIGMYTHNMEQTPEEQKDLSDALQVFNDIGYLPTEQVPSVPVLNKKAAKIVYAPLAQTPSAPDVVLLFVEADQALIVTEAAQMVDGVTPPAHGRPACAVVPAVDNTGNAAMSLGCCGARAYLDSLSPSVALFALPGAKLAEYVDKIATLSRANTMLTRFHQLRREDVARGQEPSVEQSVARLQG
ncbi:MAG: DUF169 domain-containing protein [bacterium]|nr:DUF169 domain-containing protein [bacterium]